MSDPMDIKNLAKAASEQLKEVLSQDIIVQQQGRIEELEAKLAKAVEGLQKIKQTYPADAYRLIHGDRQIIEIADDTLAELKGQGNV